ncbi:MULTISPECIES: response regulator [unclassified Aureimonas]|uniref:response regulator n=1 Tax=unclassified Aureimonas TaxID=2615206 RepID=UPI000721A640|nr:MULTISPECIES: response regulator [unclassified Aureimonas]ALN75712.1 hypothetical protein M673_23485 [Aureimonas sp. AU20]
MRVLRVLIVEDEPLIALDLQDILQDAHHEVVGIANSMTTALTLAEAHVPFDVAIMDVDLADGSNGIKTAQRLRDEHNVASLFVSGRLTEENRAMAAEWRPVGFVCKPFLSSQILGALEKVRI